jgi:rhodanese-related sulfurtransferase
MHKDLLADDFQDGFSNNSNSIILDVRTPEEYNDGHLPNALNINIMDPDFQEKIEALDKTKSYYVYCRSGGRSSTACRFMQSADFAETFNLLGGITAWRGEVVSE